MRAWLRHIICIGLLLHATSNGLAQDEITHAICKQEERLATNPDDTQALQELLFLHLHKADYQKAVDYGKRLLHVGYEKKDFDRTILYAHIGLGQAYMMLGDSTAYNYLGQARLTAEQTQNDSALCSVYNGLGLYASNVDKDYYSALHYFFKGLDASRRCRYDRLHAILQTNVAGIYYLKRDTAGLTYSLEAYESGHQQKSPYLIYISASTTAYMYYLRGNYEQALQYIKEAEFLMLQNDFYDQGNVYALYGKILTAQGDTRQAIRLFRQGLSLKEKNQTSSRVFLLHGYAQALEKERQYEEAIRLLHQALSLSHDKHSPVYRNDVIDELSKCYALKGQHAEALAWLRHLYRENDSLFNTDKEKILSELRIKYDIEQQENEIKQNKLILLQKEKKEQLLVGILVFILLGTASLWYQYRRKDRLYTSIVRQNQEALRREQQMQALIQNLQEEKHADSPLTGEKRQSLFQQLEELMQKQAAYKDNLLTREKVAEQLGTNRTYLSQVINEQTGQTFTQYINRYRINEAVRLLSDPMEEAPLKSIASTVGFNSMTTFYKLFQATVGMPPRQYRDKVMYLHRNKQA